MIRPVQTPYIFFIGIILTIAIPPANAQVAYWHRYMGGSGFDIGKALILKSDGSMVLGGETYSKNGLGIKNHSNLSDVVLLRMVTQNIRFWEVTLGGSGMEELAEVIETRDGGYALIGTSSSDDGDCQGNHGELDIWVAKLNDIGEIEWSKLFGGSGNDRGFAIEETDDGGFLIGGESGSVGGTMKSTRRGGLDSWVAKLGNTGNIVWEKHFGGNRNERVSRIHQLVSGQYWVFHISNSIDGDKTQSKGKKDVWLTELDAGGNIAWERVYGGENNDDIYDSMIDPEGNVLLVGTTFSSRGDIRRQQGKGDAWILKIAPSGDLVWSNTYGGTKADGGNHVCMTHDGGYLLTGLVRSADGDVQFNSGYYDGWVAKLTRNGNLLWSRALGYEGKDALFKAFELPYGGFLGLGFSEQTAEGTLLAGHQGNLDFWLCNFSDPKREGVKPYITPPTLMGGVIDGKTGRPIQAELSLTDNFTLKTVATTQTLVPDASFFMLMPAYGLVSINALAKGYLFYGEDVLMDSLQDRTLLERKIKLEPIKVGASLILKNIYFDTGRWELLKASFPELERLIAFMKLNPRVKILISGHTDDTGNKDQKVELSLNRAEAVKAYLVQKGIEEERLTVKGFGMFRPIASNDTYSGRQKNRRVEFEVVNL